MQGAGHGSVAHGQHHLDHAGHARGRLRVTDVGLHRSQENRLTGGPSLPVGGQQRLRLDRVTQRRARTVRLDHIHLGGRNTRLGQRRTDHALLRRTVRGRQAVGRAVLVDGRPAHHRQHRMPQPPCLGQPFQQHQADALGEPRTVRAVRERTAPPVGGHGTLPAEGGEGARRGDDGGAAGQCERAFPVPQRLGGQVDGHQRRRARRVHGDRRTLQPQQVREAAGDDAGGVAREEHAVQALRGLVQQGRTVLLGDGADEHAGRALVERRRVDAGALEGLPGGLQEQALLRVHGQRLARRDAEEGLVEPSGAVQETAVAGVGGARLVRVRVEQGVQVPATIGGELADRVGLGPQQVPQVLGSCDPAGQSASHGHDGDGVVVRRGARPRRRQGRGGRGSGEALVQVLGQGVRVGVVEDDGRGQPQTGRGIEPVAQFHRGERVEADVLEHAVGAYGVRRLVSEYRGCMPEHQGEQSALGLLR